MGLSLEENSHTDKKFQDEKNIKYGFVVSICKITYSFWDLCHNDGDCESKVVRSGGWTAIRGKSCIKIK